MTRFSIFIPIWNEAEWLPGAIESVLAQTHRDWELVIGDNASTDDLAAIAARYPDPRIRYHRWDTHTDAYENYNRTLCLTREPWVQLLCADDRVHPRCLERLAEQIEAAADQPGRVAAAITACRRVDADGKPAEARYSYQRIVAIPSGRLDGAAWLRYATRPGIAPWNFGSVALSREVLAEMGGFFRPEVGLGSDAELVLRAAAYGDILYTAEPLLDLTVRGDSDRGFRATRNRQRGDPLTSMGAAFLYGFRAHEERREVTPEERRMVRRAIARSHLQRAVHHRVYPGGRGRAGALNDIGRAFRYSPRSMLAPSHLGYALAALLLPPAILARGRDLLAARRTAPPEHL